MLLSGEEFLTKLSLCCNSDIKREKRRIARNQQDERMMRDDIRAMELELQDAALIRRKAEDRIQHAQDRLLKLKDWYGPLLTLYNPSQAEAAVNDALREFRQNEPAARGVNRPSDSSDDSNVRKANRPR